MVEVTRCINIDWLEIFALEDGIFFPHDAEFFRARGWLVRERDYGTKVWGEVFTLLGHDDEPLLELRRAPKSSMTSQAGGILSPYACHIRLCNRTCYFADPVRVLLDFVSNYGYSVQRISRIDICLDFEKFDSGDMPANFVRRYLNGRYSKINQSDIALHGRDAWDGRIFNSIKWGSPTSQVTTKLYNKTLELKQVADKPYIRQAWALAGLVDDSHDLFKVTKDGKRYHPEIWRVEFSIKSGTKNWFVIPNPKGSQNKYHSIRHTLDMYRTRSQLLEVFFSLARHYFHFKTVVYLTENKSLTRPALSAVALDSNHELYPSSVTSNRKRQRKDRCPDKVLFNPDYMPHFYKLENAASSTRADKQSDSLKKAIIAYRDTHVTPDIYKACNVILAQLEFETRAQDIARPWPSDKLTALRLLIARRLRDPNFPISLDTDTTNTLLHIYDDIFGEHDG